MIGWLFIKEMNSFVSEGYYCQACGWLGNELSWLFGYRMEVTRVSQKKEKLFKK